MTNSAQKVYWIGRPTSACMLIGEMGTVFYYDIQLGLKKKKKPAGKGQGGSW